MNGKFSGIRKWVGFFVILIVLFFSGMILKDSIYGIYAKYAFYAFLVFVGGNTIEHVKEIIGNLKK